MINEEITAALYAHQDTAYKDFQIKLIPSVDRSYFIGVRTPDLRMLAKEFSKRKDIEDFLKALPHRLFDENQLHAFIISEIKDFESCIAHIEIFLPFVDNWATCDQMSPKCFRRNKPELIKYIKKWLSADGTYDGTYTIRFAIGMLMSHFLDDDFNEDYPLMVSKVCCDEYYVSMMAAWYFATALAKQYDSVIGYLEQRRLDPATHARAIRKAIESRRLTDEQKKYLRSIA